MEVALVLTIKNEARLLRDNFLYHRAIGACHIFVYFDGTTDEGRDSIKDLDFVTIEDSVSASEYQSDPLLKKFSINAEEHHTARQCLNTYHAFQLCIRKGYDWLISIDADELVCTNKNAPSDLKSFFTEIPSEIDVVNLKVREALQQRTAYHNVFQDETVFKTTHSYNNRFEKITKSFEDPFIKEKRKFSYWYGQHAGKGCLRVTSSIVPRNVHRYILRSGEQLRVLNAGYVLHYHAYDCEDFIKKFTNFSKHPETFLSGNKVNSLKLLLRDVVNKAGKTEEELSQYFEDNIMFQTAEVEQLEKNIYLGFFKRKTKPLEKITSVQQVFRTKIYPT